MGVNRLEKLLAVRHRDGTPTYELPLRSIGCVDHRQHEFAKILLRRLKKTNLH